MYSPTLSLTDPPASSPLADSIAWIQGAALGTTATIVAVLAVATIGLLMLSGRLELRRGITVVLGCFILFGASGIAAALTDIAGTDNQPDPPVTPSPDPLSNHLRSSTSPPPTYDPYAGASVPVARQH